MRVHAHAGDDSLVVTVEDDGKWKPAQRRDERGRGLPLMRALMDGVEIRTHQARTEVRSDDGAQRAPHPRLDVGQTTHGLGCFPPTG